MLYIAFTLGLMGSLHCLGMCGPLAIAFSGGYSDNKIQVISRSLQYNLGRSITYAIIGLLFGLIGSFVFFANAQQGLSIAMGMMMIIAFFSSLNIDNYLGRSTIINKWKNFVHGLISPMMKEVQSYPPFILGMANGLLPCGLVYLALAGALTTGNLFSGGLFMFFFGLGTIPMLFGLVLGNQFMLGSQRKVLNRVIPYISLAFGIFLCYRGMVVDMPMELDFFEAVNNPLMCQ